MDAVGNGLDNICGLMETALGGTHVCCAVSENAQFYCSTTGQASIFGIAGTADGVCDRTGAGTFCKADGVFAG